MNLIPFFASIALQSEDTIAIGASIGAACCGLIVALLFVAAMWKIFTKAGQPLSRFTICMS